MESQFLAEGIHLGHVTRGHGWESATDGSETCDLHRFSQRSTWCRKCGAFAMVRSLRVRNSRMLNRVRSVAAERSPNNENHSSAIVAFGLPVGGASLGYWLGKARIAKTTIITIPT